MKTCEHCEQEKELSEFPRRYNSTTCKECRVKITKEKNRVKSKNARQKVRERLQKVDDLEKLVQELRDNIDNIKAENERLKELKKSQEYENESLRVLLLKDNE